MIRGIFLIIRVGVMNGLSRIPAGQTCFMRIMEKLDKCIMKKTLNLFVNAENIIIVFTLILHLIYGIQEGYFYI